MKPLYIDTNILIRFLTDDTPKKSKKILAFLNKNTVILPDLVVAETYYVLKSNYKLSNELICEKLLALIHNENISCNKDILVTTIEYVNTSKIHFPDAYLAALANVNSGKVVSYDKDLDIVNRIEP